VLGAEATNRIPRFSGRTCGELFANFILVSNYRQLNSKAAHVGELLSDKVQYAALSTSHSKEPVSYVPKGFGLDPGHIDEFISFWEVR
jgi:hypothetical protein